MGKHGVCVSRDSWWDASELKVLQVRVQAQNDICPEGQVRASERRAGAKEKATTTGKSGQRVRKE
jgi:hypothetical protein